MSLFWPFSNNRGKIYNSLSQIILTDEFRSILSLFENSSNNFFLTGNAGTGKTALIQRFQEETKKNTVVLAPTGVAAINAGGKTIHSFFHLPPRIITSDVIDKLRSNNRIYKAVDTIIIDEVSMVRADVLDGIDYFMRRKGRDSQLPFGGAQIILAGDPYQLPPVVTSMEESIISKLYETPYFFSAKAYAFGKFQSLKLTEVHRQHDAKFIEFLNLVRHGDVNSQTLQLINDRFARESGGHFKNQGVTLTTTNKVADTINHTELLKLSDPEYEFEACIEGEFPEDKDVIIPRRLVLRNGARVMVLKNTGKFNNGDMGVVKKLDEGSISIKLDSTNEEISVLRDEWENIRYNIDSGSNKIVTEVIGKLKQFPLRLAWAITIHKSQGMSFDRVNIDYTRSPFVGGQTYVALSRCRTIEGLTITKELYPNDVFVDNRVVSYMNDLQNIKI